MLQYWLCVFLIFTTLNCCYAAIYEHRDKSGSFTYSDTPLNDNAKAISEITTSQITSTPAPAQATKPDDRTSLAEDDKKSYTIFEITTPHNQETIRNQASINIELQIEPALQKGHEIQFYLDGEPHGAAVTTPSLAIAQLERGTHYLMANIIDENGNKIKQTSIITIYVQQNHR